MGKNKSIFKGTKSPEAEKPLDIVETAKDQLDGFGQNFFDQLVGFSLTGKSDSSESYRKSPDAPLIVKDPVTGAVEVFNAASGKSADNKAHSEKASKKDQRDAAINYGEIMIKSSEASMHKEMREVNQRLQEIMSELQRLISSSKELKMEFADVGVEQAPTQAGEYHLNFFDWLLLTIRAAREKVEDSGAWLNAVKGKKDKKGYWGMFKKHGTTFGLSNERSVATQTG